MITLQRASAGSGKTYTLTKEYIGLLISTDINPNSPEAGRRLRTRQELADSVAHVLGVTFTNKATNEMKERIITKLDELAHHPPGNPKLPDYMADYMAEFGASREEVGEACREVLEQLLYNYSDFNISTIDSFFQNILRTFAYESDLPDSYQVIIDTDHLAAFATNDLVDDVAHGKTHPDERYWINRLLETNLARGSSQWNMFLRKGDGRGKGVFREISESAASLEKMQNRDVRKALDDYRDKDMNLREQREIIINELTDRAMDLFAPVAAGAEEVLRVYSEVGLPEKVLPYGNTTAPKLRKLTSEDADPFSDITLDKRIKSHAAAAYAKKTPELKPLWEKFMEDYSAWRAFVEGEDVRCWQLIDKALPGVALTDTLHRRIQDYLNDNGAMQLSDTNSMIRRIIADDEVPFIYERLGTRLNHFLIDEFQDTSRMQWENFRPLLAESESHAYRNLIIGDAKQSIYRFRNAEPRLITNIVPDTFRGHIESRGDSVAENSNWRSRSNIVKFNNFFFSTLAARLAEERGDEIKTLYGNAIQLPRSKDLPEDKPEAGYVEINFYPRQEQSPMQEEDEDDIKGETIPGALIRRIGDLIMELLGRGYRQKEIAVLTNRRQPAKDIIAGLMNYNRSLPEGTRPLEFVSEDSLTLESSPAVLTVIECFKVLQENLENGGARRMREETRDGAERQESSGHNRTVDWEAVQTNFIFFSARHPELSLPERLDRFFEDGMGQTEVDDLVAGMQAITLPSLVEAFAESFLTRSQRKLEAPFLAALQDAVLDYCEANPTDIGSMLRWWNSRGKNISISSPEDTDAINVMTIHKSKGLEFECVILPDLDLLLDLNKRGEMLWVDVPQTLAYAHRLPAMLPMTLTVKNAEGTAWEDRVAEERYQVTVDNLNKVYVAMTRAVSELYVFLPEPFAKAKQNETDAASAPAEPIAEDVLFCEPTVDAASAPYIRGHAYAICHEADGSLPAGPVDSMLPVCGDIAAGEDFRTFCYGKPVSDVAKALEKSREKKTRSVESVALTEYFVNSDRDVLKFHPEWQPHVMEEADDDRVDPLSEGSEMHGVLEYVITEDDLPYALERMRGRGILTRRKIRQYQPRLQEALESVRDRGWFDGSYTVYNERPMLAKGQQLRRPDRVMVSAEGDAIVVDYKFSTPENFAKKVEAHRRQVGEYMGWLEEMKQFRSVRGYIWYVNKGEIIEVEKAISFAEQKERQRREREERRHKERADDTSDSTLKKNATD